MVLRVVLLMFGCGAGVDDVGVAADGVDSDIGGVALIVVVVLSLVLLLLSCMVLVFLLLC